MARVTLQTIADQVGVSRMTVSNAFSRPDQLSATLRDTILAVADELGYGGPDPAARALVSGTAGAIGVVLSDALTYTLTDDVAMAFLAGIAEQLGPGGRALTLLPAAPADGSMPARDVAIDGALVYSCHSDSTAVSWLMRRRLPVVFVDQAAAPGIPSVNVDDRIGRARGRAAPGRSRAPPHRHRHHRLRRRVRRPGRPARDAAGEHRAATAARLVGRADRGGHHPTVVRLPHTDPQEIGYDGRRLLLELDDRRPASCASPTPSPSARSRRSRTRGLAPSRRRLGRRLRRQPGRRRTRPALTTVRQDSQAKGRAAANLLITALDQRRDGCRRRHERVGPPAAPPGAAATSCCRPSSSCATAPDAHLGDCVRSA